MAQVVRVHQFCERSTRQQRPHVQLLRVLHLGRIAVWIDGDCHGKLVEEIAQKYIGRSNRAQ